MFKQIKTSIFKFTFYILSWYAKHILMKHRIFYNIILQLKKLSFTPYTEEKLFFNLYIL